MHLGIIGTSQYTAGAAFALLGEADSAFAAANRAFAAHDENLGYVRSEPMWAPFYADPRFAAVVYRLGLPP